MLNVGKMLSTSFISTVTTFISSKKQTKRHIQSHKFLMELWLLIHLLYNKKCTKHVLMFLFFSKLWAQFGCQSPVSRFYCFAISIVSKTILIIKKPSIQVKISEVPSTEGNIIRKAWKQLIQEGDQSVLQTKKKFTHCTQSTCENSLTCLTTV